jgi:hypothetical protein
MDDRGCGSWCETWPRILSTELRMELPSCANLRENRWARARRVKSQRAATGLHLLQFGVPAAPVDVVLTRVHGRRVDSDNLASLFKAVRDGVTDWLRRGDRTLDDGDPRLRWFYEQETGGGGRLSTLHGLPVRRGVITKLRIEVYRASS